MSHSGSDEDEAFAGQELNDADIEDGTDQQPARPSGPADFGIGLDDGSGGSDDEMEILHPDHPALRRVQEALKRQLLRKKQEIEEELRERERDLKAFEQEREQLGVQLYNLQQQFSSVQKELANAEGGVQQAAEKRVGADKSLEEAKQQHEDTLTVLKNKEKEAAAVQAEYNSLREKVQTLERHANELQSKLKGAKTAATKAAKEQDKLEAAKQQQDLLADRLQDRAASLEKEITVLSKQKEAQVAETKEAQLAVEDAQMEIDEMSLRKKEAQQLLQSGMAGLSKRNEALTSMQQAVRNEHQEMIAKDREIENVDKQVQEEQARNETLTAQLMRIESDIATLEKRMQTVKAKQETVEREYSMVQKSLETTEQQLAQAKRDANAMELELKQARDRMDRLSQEKIALEEELVEKMQGKLTVDNASKGIAKAIADIRNKIMQQEEVMVKVENDVSKEVLKAAEIEAELEKMAEVEKQRTLETQDLENDIASYEKTLKSNYVALEKKQTVIDQLNKKIGVIKERLAAEGAGNLDISPAELEIKRIRKQITDAGEENASAQAQWLSRQSELVSWQRKGDELGSQAEKLRVRQDVLTRKRARVDDEIEQEKSYIAQRQREFRALQQELTKLHTLVSQNKDLQGQLEQSNTIMKKEFLRELKDTERECVQLQDQLDSLYEERERLVNAAVEAQRQLLLWEKKIQLAKETKAEIQNDDTSQELEEMRREIHRMELRYQQLQRHKEDLIVQMERSVERREHITDKAKIKQKKGLTQAQAKRDVELLQKRVKQAQRSANQTDKDAQALRLRQTEVKAELEDSEQRAEELRALELKCGAELTEKRLLRRRNLEDIVAAQRAVRHYEQLERKRLKLRFQDRDSYNQSMQRQVETMKGLHSISDYFMKEYPEAQGLEEVRDLLDFKLGTLDGSVEH